MILKVQLAESKQGQRQTEGVAGGLCSTVNYNFKKKNILKPPLNQRKQKINERITNQRIKVFSFDSKTKKQNIRFKKKESKTFDFFFNKIIILACN